MIKSLAQVQQSGERSVNLKAAKLMVVLPSAVDTSSDFRAVSTWYLVEGTLRFRI